MGTHHLEYGFPSTHSTNSVSIALFLFGQIYLLAQSNPDAADSEPMISSQTYTLMVVGLIIYTFSIVFGRIYTAMHSFTDCAAGVLLGSAIWWSYTSFPGIPVTIPSSTMTINVAPGLGIGEVVTNWVQHGGWEVPTILIPICLLAVNQHPQPVDDCPCFEDAIAFCSVVLGTLLGKWGIAYSGFVQRTPVVMAGSGWVFDKAINQWITVERGVNDVLVWWSVAALKMAVGILTIIAWRILAKSLLHVILPPIFRVLARAFQLPNRRFYTPATDYKNVPSEFAHANGLGGLRPIPSVIDLPGTAGVEVGGIGSGCGYGSSTMNGMNDMKLRNEKVRFSSGLSKAIDPAEEVEEVPLKEDVVKHYDADGEQKLRSIDKEY